MLWGLISIFIGLCFPLALFFFQERDPLSRFFIDFHIKLPRMLFYFLILLVFITTIEYLDNRDIPSKICLDFANKRFLIDNFLYFIMIFFIAFTIDFYRRYYVFCKKTITVKNDELISEQIKLLMRIQKKDKWINTNIEIEEYNDNKSFNILDSELSIKNKDIGLKSNMVISKVKLHLIEEEKGKCFIWVSCGKKTKENQILCTVIDEDTKTKILKYKKRLFQIRDDQEDRLYELLHITIDEIEIKAKNKKYHFVNEYLKSLVLSLDKIAFSEFLLPNLDIFYRDIYWLVNGMLNVENPDPILSRIVKNFCAAIITSSINDNHKTYFSNVLSITLNKYTIDLESNDVINRGIVYVAYEAFKQISENVNDTDYVFSKELFIRLFIIVFDLSESDKQKIKIQISEKDFLFNPFRIKGYCGILYKIFLKYFDESISIINSKSEWYYDFIHSIQTSFFEKRDLLIFLERDDLFQKT